MTGTTTLRSDSSTFRGPADSGLPNLAGLPGVHRLEPGTPVVDEIERFDTDDRRLAAAGIRLARHSGAEAFWRLDLPDGDGTERLQVPATEEAEPAVPEEFTELVRGAARERAVRPAARLRSVRTRIRLHGDGDRPVGAVTHDELTLATLGRSTDVEAWAETSVHADGGDLLVALAARATEAGLRPAAPAGEAELERLLRPVRRRGPAGRVGSGGAVLVDGLGRQADRLAAEDLRVRRGEPDAVHRMRVASRRLRSAIAAYRPVLDRGRTDPIAAGLRDLGRALAPARDAEVLRERIDADLAALPPELLLGPVRAQATRHFARAEAEARAAVLTTLDGPEYATLRRALDELLEHPPLTKAAARTKLDAGSTSSRLRRSLKRAVTTGDDTALHDARKAAKRLRYANEVTGVRMRGLKALQKALGEHQDAVVAAPVLRELGAAADNGFSFGVLLGQAQARAASVEEALPALWKRVKI